MNKIINSIKKLLPSKRRIIQLYAALLFNANLKGFGNGRIYQGKLKNICTPGLNCYSCPGASGSCPLGALQNSLSASPQRLPYYVVGIILLYGLLFGRFICGFLCPSGLIQELLHKIKTPKLKKGRITRVLSYFKYVILVVLVIIFPLIYAFKKFPLPGFCKYICPAGTLEGAMGLLSNKFNDNLFGMLGPLFTWKFVLLIVFLVGAIFIYRFFCRFFCPLGALYGLFNKFSFIGVKLDTDKCIDCGKCVKECKMDIRHVSDHECISCGECISVCPTRAISWKGPKILLHANEIPSDPSPEREKAVKRAKQSKLVRVICVILAGATLVGALYYYNFVDKVSEPENVDPPVVTDPDNEIVFGNQVGQTCYYSDLEVVNSDSVKTFNVESNKGKITIINFWGTWCGPCVAELPHFNMIASEYADSVSVVALHSDYLKNTLDDYISENYPDTNILFGADNTDKYFKMLGGRDSWPVTVIVDQNGLIVMNKTGSVTYEALKSEIEKCLEE